MLAPRQEHRLMAAVAVAGFLGTLSSSAPHWIEKWTIARAGAYCDSNKLTTRGEWDKTYASFQRQDKPYKVAVEIVFVGSGMTFVGAWWRLHRNGKKRYKLPTIARGEQ